MILSHSPALGTILPVGPSSVTLTVSDAAGNSANCVIEVTVVDTISPVISPNQVMTFASIGASSAGCTNVGDQLDEKVSSDGLVKMNPSVRVSAPCLKLSQHWNNQAPVNENPEFCYNSQWMYPDEGFAQTGVQYPLTIQKRNMLVMQTQAGVCAGEEVNVNIDFTASTERPSNLHFTIADLDNKYDSLRLQVYSNGALVPYEFQFVEPDLTQSFVKTTYSSPATNAIFNGNGCCGPYSDANNSSFSAWSKGAVRFVTPAGVSIDSIVVTNIINTPAVATLRPSYSIGAFYWNKGSNVLPQDTTVACLSEVPAAAELFISDNCGIQTQTVVDVESDRTCDNKLTITRTWTAIDNSNNTTTYSQIITVKDSIAPTFDSNTLPQNITVSCDAIPAFDLLTATDNCSAVTVDTLQTITAGTCANNYTITRTWTATDACDNETVHTQIITVEDTTAPVFDTASLPVAAISVSCENIPTPATVIATHNCSPAAEIVYNVNDTDDQGAAGTCSYYNYIITRVYTATDAYGNAETFTQLITVSDTTRPAWDTTTLPADVTVGNGQIPAPSTTITGTDNCASAAELTLNVTDTDNQGAAGTCDFYNYVIERKYELLDPCLNRAEFIQIITVRDTVGPVFDLTGVNLTQTVSCSDPTAAVTLTATDDATASADIVITMTEVTTPIGTGDCAAYNYLITRTYTATDICGNTSEVVLTVTVEDTTAPVIVDCPANQTIYVNETSCTAEATWIAPTATDACSAVNMVSTHNPGFAFSPGVNAVTYTATDLCGNESTCTFDIEVIDNIKPIIVVSNLDSVVCQGTAVTWTVNATDNCTVASVTSSHPSGTVFKQGTTAVTITATDNSGNATTYQFNILVTAPPVVEPAQYTYEVCERSALNMSILGADSLTSSWVH